MKKLLVSFIIIVPLYAMTGTYSLEEFKSLSEEQMWDVLVKQPEKITIDHLRYVAAEHQELLSLVAQEQSLAYVYTKELYTNPSKEAFDKVQFLMDTYGGQQTAEFSQRGPDGKTPYEYYLLHKVDTRNFYEEPESSMTPHCLTVGVLCLAVFLRYGETRVIISCRDVAIL